MALVTLRRVPGVASEDDIHVEVQEKTWNHLMTAPAPTARVSTYLDRDWPQIEAQYAELYLDETCPFVAEVTRITPGSRIRTGIRLPAPMRQGEQLTIEVRRKPR
jgi:hypothetical protein